MSNKAIERVALGRTARIGDLYDARSECFTGNSIFKKVPDQTLLHITDSSFTDFHLVLSDKFSDKAATLNLDDELKVSVLAGLVELEGSGQCLKWEKKSAKAVRCALFHTCHTQVEQLNLFAQELKDFCNLEIVDDKATHFVVKVCWGANSVIAMEYANHEKNNVNDVIEDLRTHLSRLLSHATSRNSSCDGKTAAVDSKKCVVHMFADIVPHDKLPQSYIEATEIMEIMPEYLAASNDGKGQPLTFMLMPLSDLKHFLNQPTLYNCNEKPQQIINEQLLAQVIKLFDEISIINQTLNDLYLDMDDHEMCVTRAELDLLSKEISNFNVTMTQIKAKLFSILIGIRSVVVSVEELEAVKINLQTHLQQASHVQGDHCKIIQKMALVDSFAKEGATYIGLGSSHLSSQKSHRNDLYVLYHSEECKTADIICWNSNKTLFLNLLHSSKTEITFKRSKSAIKEQCHQPLFIVLDTDLRPELMLDASMKKSIRICLYRNGKCINENLLHSNKTQQLLCLVHSDERREPVQSLPKKLIVLLICCPGAISGTCPSDDLTWVCDKCNTHIQYGFDMYFYCKCHGNARLFSTRYKFKCNNSKHGEYFISFQRQSFAPLLGELKPSNKYLNILILGETGVGKSTWINGIANYTSFSSLTKASESEPMSLIGASFTVMDNNLQGKVITIGEDGNENSKTGQSATQDPKAYVFNWRGTSVRVIDTPGIGDTRGIDQDKANFEAILKFVSELKEIHGICILLKPNNARLGVMFRFCIKELLTHLHRSCSNNIVFCFTNARNTFYKPGDTFPALKQLLLENNEVEIVLSKDTIYCMDNESFRYLCMIHHGIASDESEMVLYSTSWDKSVAETNRLLKHIKSLKPHVVQDTLSLNNTRRIVINLTKPIASISQNIQANIAVIEDKKTEIKILAKGLEELKNKLYVPGIDLVAVALGYPRTVCTSPQCVKYHTIDNTTLTKIEYITHCHPYCYLTGVRPESYPNPDLLGCDAMAGTQNCIHCKCEWGKHMHITYDQVHQSRQLIDSSIENLINSKKSDSEKIELFVKELEARQEALQEEQAIIRKACAKFGTFLKNNAMLTYNDALAEYLDILIKQEKDKCHSDGDRRALEGFETMRQEYLEEVATLQMAVKNGNNSGCLSIVEINRLVKTLYALPIKGAELKQHMEVAAQSKFRMVSYNETHCYPISKPARNTVTHTTEKPRQALWQNMRSKWQIY